MRHALPALVVCLITGPLALAQPAGPSALPGIVTVLDGPSRLIRGVSLYAPAEGSRVRPGDILEVDDGALIQVEFPDGVAVSIAGPGRAMLLSFGAAASRAPVEVFLLSGFFKGAAPSTAQLKVTTPHLDAAATGGTMVIRESAGAVALFDETGQVVMDGPGGPSRLRGGDFCARRGDQRPLIANRPDPSFVAAVPRPFLDALPARWSKFADREAPLKGPREFTYEQVEAWLGTSPAIRRILVARWQSKANDPAFRKALLANLRNHPEWYGVLFPDKQQTGR